MHLRHGDDTVRTYKISSGKSPVGDIMIHGYSNKVPAFLFRFLHKWNDWTADCIAVTNDGIKKIYDAVKDGTPVTIHP